MQSIPKAMTWELFARGGWSLLAGALGALAFPAIVFTALAHEGALNPDDESTIVMHLVMVQMNGLGFGAALFGVLWPMSRLYAAPATTATLVAWRLVPAMIAMFVETALWTTAINALFGFHWPLWGPALFSAVSVAAFMSMMWLAINSAWVALGMTVVGVTLGMWFKTRYGPLSGTVNRMWSTLTPTETFTLLAFAAVAYGVAVFAVARNRRGEPPFSVGVVGWLMRVFDRPPARGEKFPSPAAAQFWIEWKKGPAMPACVLIWMFIGLVVWLIASRRAEDLVEGLYVGGGLLGLVGFIGGALLGVTGPKAGDVMGTFLATRPMTTIDMTGILVRVGMKSLLIAWAIWAAAFAAVYGLELALGVQPPELTTPQAAASGYWFFYFPATLLGPWILLGTCATIVLSGRPSLWMKVLSGLFASQIGLLLCSKFFLSDDAQDVFERGLANAWGGVFLVLTAWLFVAARRRGLISRWAAWGAAAVWATAVVAMLLLAPPNGPPPIALLSTGILALVVAPLASFPLALAWNRTR